MRVSLIKNVYDEYYHKIEVNITTENNYFSITGTVFDKDDNCTTTGCLHHEIMKHFPELELLIELHLNALDGKPMYFVQNSMHFYKHNNISGLASYGFNDRQARYLIDAQPDEDIFNRLIDRWNILGVWKYKAMSAIKLIENL